MSGCPGQVSVPGAAPAYQVWPGPGEAAVSPFLVRHHSQMPAPEASVFGMGCSRRRGANSCQIHPSLSRVAWACVAKSPAVLYFFGPPAHRSVTAYM